MKPKKQASRPEAKWIRASGAVTSVEPENGGVFSLEELQKMVGGYIEVVEVKSTGRVARLVVNEEGRLLGLKPNALATQLWREGATEGSPRHREHIVGDAVLCHGAQLGEEGL